MKYDSLAEAKKEAKKIRKIKPRYGRISFSIHQICDWGVNREYFV